MSNGSSTATMNLSIVNQAGSGASDDQIWIAVLGLDPATGAQAYLDLASSPPAMVSPYTYQSGVTSRTLAQIETTFGTSIPIPAIQSARIYFAVGADLPDGTPFSGPSPSKSDTSFFDFAEFDTHAPGSYNVNPSTVVFYGVSYTLSAVPAGQAEAMTVGFTNSRQTVLDALWSIPASPAAQRSGNLGIFPGCFVAAGTPSNVLRVLSPASMALTDWGPITDTTLATQCSHFMDGYVNEHCFRPNRTLSFYTKNYVPGGQDNEVVYARVSGDGLTTSVFTDPAMTQPYAVPSLGRPSAPWPLPDFSTPASYHDIVGASADEIDWGFLLIGNAGAPATTGGSPPEPNLAWAWGNDPAAMALMISICRGVAHLDDGTTAWVDASSYYPGNGQGTPTESMPTLYYASVLHAQAVNGLAYALAFDDIYQQNPSIFFADGATVTLTLVDVSTVAPPSA